MIWNITRPQCNLYWGLGKAISNFISKQFELPRRVLLLLLQHLGLPGLAPHQHEVVGLAHSLRVTLAARGKPVMESNDRWCHVTESHVMIDDVMESNVMIDDVMESFWGHSGVILGSSWGHPGVILGSSWVILGSLGWVWVGGWVGGGWPPGY